MWWSPRSRSTGIQLGAEPQRFGRRGAGNRKGQADASVQAAEDKTAMIKAKFAVRRAELDVSKNELLSEIDAKKNDLALEGPNGRWRNCSRTFDRMPAQTRRDSR